VSYSVEILLDSVAPSGARLTTFKLKYPAMIHAEFLTHRAISRNASSTRAIPTVKMIEWVMKDPAMPVYWGKNQRGMRADRELGKEYRLLSRARWLAARDDAVESACALLNFGAHKQIASRLLQPWMHMNVVASATEWSNFFALRCHKDAQPEMQHLAVKMARAYRDSKPRPFCEGMWHLPFITEEEWFDTNVSPNDLRKISVARCARVSYKAFDDTKTDMEADITLRDKLRANGHFSPFEHQAWAMSSLGQSGNFVGWQQYRHMLPRGVHTEFDFSVLDQFEDIPE
jgi:thymidylate synthase ThyX